MLLNFSLPSQSDFLHVLDAWDSSVCIKFKLTVVVRLQFTNNDRCNDDYCHTLCQQTMKIQGVSVSGKNSRGFVYRINIVCLLMHSI